MEIQKSIIHCVEKEEKTTGPSTVNIRHRNSLLPIDENLKKLCEAILKLYGRVSNSYGKLGENLAVDRFPKFLSDYHDDTSDFEAFSILSTEVLADEMSKKLLTTTSYPIFIAYTNQGRKWILIAVMKLKNKVGIDEKTLNLNSALTFEVNDLREAARIDIEKWANNSQPYLSFIKRGSGKDTETSEYFRNALSCLDYTDAKHNTDEALRAFDDFSKSQNLPPESIKEIRSKIYAHCKEKKEIGDPVVLTTLSAIVNDQDPEAFVLYVRENDYEVSEKFSPHPGSYNRYKRLGRRYGSINISFDVDDLATGKVDYNEDLGSILLSDPPEDLIADIRKAKGLDAGENE